MGSSGTSAAVESSCSGIVQAGGGAPTSHIDVQCLSRGDRDGGVHTAPETAVSAFVGERARVAAPLCPSEDNGNRCDPGGNCPRLNGPRERERERHRDRATGRGWSSDGTDRAGHQKGSGEQCEATGGGQTSSSLLDERGRCADRGEKPHER
jgi:hypothetical protein